MIECIRQQNEYEKDEPVVRLDRNGGSLLTPEAWSGIYAKRPNTLGMPICMYVILPSRYKLDNIPGLRIVEWQNLNAQFAMIIPFTQVIPMSSTPANPVHTSPAAVPF